MEQNQTAVFLTTDGKRIEMSDRDESLVVAAIRAIQERGGSNTPTETFIERILMQYKNGAFDRRSVEWALGEWDNDIETQSDYLRAAARLYPERTRAILAEAEAERTGEVMA